MASDLVEIEEIYLYWCRLERRRCLCFQLPHSRIVAQLVPCVDIRILDKKNVTRVTISFT